MGPHSSHSCLSSCGSARSRRNLSFSHRPRPPAQKTEASPFRLIFKPNQIRSDRHLQSPFCRVALALPTASPAPAQPVRVWLKAQAFRHRRSCCLKSAPGPTWVAFSPRAPPGSARDLALKPIWLIDRPAGTAHPSVKSSGVNVRVALAGLRSPGRCGSLSQAAPSRWLRSNLFKWQPPVFTDSDLRGTHKPAAVPPSELRGV